VLEALDAGRGLQRRIDAVAVLRASHGGGARRAIAHEVDPQPDIDTYIACER
jgi:hypothetical protein